MNVKENTETTKTKERKSSRNWKEPHMIFHVLPIICIILFSLGGFLYLCGRLNYNAGTCILYPAIGGLIIWCFLASTGRLFNALKKHIWKRKLIIAAEVVIPIVFIMLLFVHAFVTDEPYLWPPGRAFTYGFRDRIKSKADIPAIRDWLQTLSKEDYTVENVRIPPDEWPNSLKVLDPDPTSVYLWTDKNGNPKIRITWGGAIFHWGVTIGMEDMEIPSSYLNNFFDSWLLVEPGVYIWDF